MKLFAPILLLIFPIVLLIGGPQGPPGPLLRCAYGSSLKVGKDLLLEIQPKDVCIKEVQIAVIQFDSQRSIYKYLISTILYPPLVQVDQNVSTI